MTLGLMTQKLIKFMTLEADRKNQESLIICVE